MEISQTIAPINLANQFIPGSVRVCYIYQIVLTLEYGGGGSFYLMMSYLDCYNGNNIKIESNISIRIEYQIFCAIYRI